MPKFRIDSLEISRYYAPSLLNVSGIDGGQGVWRPEACILAIELARGVGCFISARKNGWKFWKLEQLAMAGD